MEDVGLYVVVGKGNLYVEFNVEWPLNRSDEIWGMLEDAFRKKPENE